MGQHASSKAILLEHQLKPKKSFGQNFMVNEAVNDLCAKAVTALSEDKLPILEIGAGTGSLTKHLLKIGSTIHAIERDRDLVPILHGLFEHEIKTLHLVIHEADGARFDLSSLFTTQKPGVLVGNLPYHLTSSIILLALKYRHLLKGAVFLVQREVADRLLASPHSKTYGFLTVLVKLFANVDRVANVDRNAFWPVPKVDSTIIRLGFRDDGPSKITELDPFLLFVRELFQKRRKKISTILKDKFRFEQFAMLHIDPNFRPENLLPTQFLKLFLAIKNGE